MRVDDRAVSDEELEIVKIDRLTGRNIQLRANFLLNVVSSGDR